MADKRIINIRVTDEEASILTAYVEATGQTRTDVLRAYIRSLAKALEQRRRKARPALEGDS